MPDDDLNRVAKARADHIPAETAGHRIQEGTTKPGRTGDSRKAGPPKGQGQVAGVRGMPRGDLNLGDESTGGQAAEQAVGARPGESDTEIDDRSER